MKVWVVAVDVVERSAYCGEEMHLIGVFDSKKAAKDARRKYKNRKTTIIETELNEKHFPEYNRKYRCFKRDEFYIGGYSET